MSGSDKAVRGNGSRSGEATHYENTPIQIYRKFNFQKLKISDKNLRYFHIFALNIDSGYSLEEYPQSVYEYPHSMLLSKNKKGNVYPCKPPFYYIKVEFKGVIVYRHVFVISFTLLCFPSEQESTLNGKNILRLGAPHQWLL